MTSTNVFTGMANGRNSSRVLRPPGGGHTDVLGLTTPPEQPQEKKVNPRNISSITEGTNTNVTPAAPAKTTEPKPLSEKPKEVVTKEAAPEPPATKEAALAPPATKEGAPAPAPANTRGRVPPGGFSSGGFW